DREPHSLAHLLLLAPWRESPGGGVGRVGDEVVPIFLDRHPEWANQRCTGELAVLADWKCNGDEAAEANLAPFIDGRTIRRKNHVAVEHEPADAHLIDFRRLAWSEADDVAVLLDDRLRYAMREGEPRMLGEMPRFAVHRNDDLRPHPIVHLDQLRAAGVARDVD